PPRNPFTARKMAEQEAPVAVEAPTPVLGEPMDLMTALQLVMKKSSAHDGLVKGLREAAKAIEKHAAQLCVLAEDCDQPDYVKLVKALCAEHNVHLVTVPAAKTLGEWAGLCKIDSEGKARKVVGCSCVVVKDYGEESEGLNIPSLFLICVYLFTHVSIPISHWLMEICFVPLPCFTTSEQQNYQTVL
ncbi:hypothetical protein ACJX0J_030421, partial [Zea mays]